MYLSMCLSTYLAACLSGETPARDIQPSHRSRSQAHAKPGLQASAPFPSIPFHRTTLRHVWLLRDVPAPVSKRLRLPRADEGIDLIALDRHGEYWAIQATAAPSCRPG
jgi:hypothetical protein